MKTKLVWALVALTLIGTLTFAWTPYGIKSYVQSNYPGVRVQNVFLRWSFVGFEGVEIDRPGIKGNLAAVYVNWKAQDDIRNVWVYGGKLEVALSEAERSDAKPSKMNIQGSGLTVNVAKPGLVAQLKGVSFDSHEIRFKSGTATYKGFTPIITEGRYTRSAKLFRAKHLELPFEMPFEIPKIEKNQTVRLDQVEVTLEPLRVTFGSASLDPFFKIKAKSTVDPVPEMGANLEVNELEVNHPWVSPDPVTFHKVEATVTLAKRVVVKINGGAMIDIDVNNYSIEGSEDCNTWVDAMPAPLPEALQRAKGHFTGKLSFNVQRDPAPQLNLTNRCKFDCSTDLGKSLRSGRITYMAYDKDDKLFARTVGPGMKGWVDFNELPPHVPKAFITLEDPGFMGHRGIIPQALENSFKDNLKLGRFFRGGSTISMQLAKNLWLKRHKTIGRKAQEAFLTIVLESCLSKTEILELYTNVVEFGPNLYGIGPATKAYFDKEPGELEPEEAFYLASILPHPRKAIPPASGGLKRIQGLMRVLAARGFISEALIPVREDEVDSAGWETE